MQRTESEWACLLDQPAFALARQHKRIILNRTCQVLHEHHLKASPAYRTIVAQLFSDGSFAGTDLETFPFIPVRLFKELDLLSVGQDQVFKTMTSSGTSGQALSKIFLDRTTAQMQTKVLAHIVSQFMGKKRLPLLVIDSASTMANAQSFSARAAGIRGFLMFGRDVEYALDEHMNLDEHRVVHFLDRHAGEPILLFGFTAMIWHFFVEQLKRRELYLPMDQGILFHGGGWKKMIDQAVNPDTFRNGLADWTGIKNVHDYYGMVEQTGSICVECSKGSLHVSSFSDILIRDSHDFRIQPNGQAGLIQMISVLPFSYPGFSVLTEDMGRILGEDDCPCGLKGRYFEVLGRIPRAEVRGCSDSYVAP